MFDFKNLSEIKVCTMLNEGINPLTGERCNQCDIEKISKIIKVIHSAIRNYEIDFNPLYVFIPGIDARIKIVEQISIKPFSENIAETIEIAVEKHTTKLSAKHIQNSILRYLSDDGLIEYNKNTYRATHKGEICGIINAKITNEKYKKREKVFYNSYMQAYIIRNLPDILYFDLFYKYENNCYFGDLINIIEPLTIEEQQLITKYRSLNKDNKKLIETTVNTLFNKSIFADKKSISFK